MKASLTALIRLSENVQFPSKRIPRATSRIPPHSIMQLRKSLSHQADRYSPVLAEAYAVESLLPLAPSVMTGSFRGEVGITGITCYKNSVAKDYHTPAGSNRIKDFLSRKSWPQGLQNFLINGLAGISMRYFVCDDSGSMHSSDGHRIFGEGSAAKYVIHPTVPNVSLLLSSVKCHSNLFTLE